MNTIGNNCPPGYRKLKDGEKIQAGDMELVDIKTIASVSEDLIGEYWCDGFPLHPVWIYRKTEIAVELEKRGLDYPQLDELLEIPTSLEFTRADPTISFKCVCGEGLQGKIGVPVKCPVCGKMIKVDMVPEEEGER